MEFSIGLLVIAAVVLSSAVKILPEWERGVILRFGRSVGIRGPGLIILIPFVERIIKVDTRTIAMDVQPQDIITKDNVSMKVNAVVYFKVVAPEEAITKVEDFYFATSQLAQTTLRSVLGQYQLDWLGKQKLSESAEQRSSVLTGNCSELKSWQMLQILWRPHQQLYNLLTCKL